MRFEWDWLSPVVTVPYVPTLGPVHPDALGPELFAEVTDVAGSGRFLAHDKDQRWADFKDETVLVDAITHRPGLTLVPTLTRRGRGCVKLHRYGAGAPDLAELREHASKLQAEYGAGSARVIWFEADEAGPPAGVTSTRVQLKTFGSQELPQPAVRDLRDHPSAVVATFSGFARQMAADGFAFLWERFEAGTLDGPILTTAVDGRVVGAIGPMEIMKDPVGRARLLPQYFGVLPDQRGRGLGRRLWRGAMYWGQTTGAAYQLLQTELGGASDRLCQAQGLAGLGFVLTAPV